MIMVPTTAPTVQPAPRTSGRARARSQRAGVAAPRTRPTSAVANITRAQLALARHKAGGYQAQRQEQLGELGFSLKPPKAVRKIATAVKKAVTIKNVAKVAAIGAAAVIAAPLIGAAARVALPAIAKGATAVAKGAFSAVKAVPRTVVSAERAIVKAVLPTPTIADKANESTAVPDGLTMPVDVLKDIVQAKVDQATATPPTSAAPNTSADTGTTTAASAPVYGPPAPPVYGPPAPTPAKQADAWQSPSYSSPIQSGFAPTSASDASATTPNGAADGLPKWLLPAGLGVAVLMLAMNTGGPSRARESQD